MSTITKTASTNTILAIDLGKYKSVVCIHERDGEVRFLTLDTGRAELRCLIEKERPSIVIIEACLLAGWVHNLCVECGVRCRIANTASEAWKFKHLKRKTDRDDALRLAQLYLLDQLPTVTLPPTAVRQWRSLMAVRQSLVGRRVAVQNRIRAIFVGQGLPAPRGARAWLETGLSGMARFAKPLAECGPEELWRGLLDLALVERRQTMALVAEAEQRLNAWARRTPTSCCCRRRRAWGRARRRRWRPTCTTRRVSRPASRCRPTAAWCRGNISRARWIDVAGSPGVARRCCASCWSNAPGAWCVTTPGRVAITCG